MSSIREETKKTKDIMYHSIKDYIELSLHLFSVYISQSGWSIYIYIYIFWGVTGFLGSLKISPCEERRLKDTQNPKCEDRRLQKLPSFED